LLEFSTYKSKQKVKLRMWNVRETSGSLQALNPSYAEHSPAASIDRGVLNSATWGRSPEAIRELILRNLSLARENPK